MKCRRLMGFRPHAEDHTLAYHWATDGLAHRRNISPSMSQMGHKQTFAGSKRKSGLPPKPDIKRSDQTSTSRATDITGS